MEQQLPMVLDDSTLESSFKHVNGVNGVNGNLPPPLNRPVLPAGAHSSHTLLSKFIEARKDLAKYKYVSLSWVSLIISDKI